MRKSKGGSDENPNRQCYSNTTSSVTRALRAAGVFLSQVAVVAGIRKVLDWLIP